MKSQAILLSVAVLCASTISVGAMARNNAIYTYDLDEHASQQHKSQRKAVMSEHGEMYDGCVKAINDQLKEAVTSPSVRIKKSMSLQYKGSPCTDMFKQKLNPIVKEMLYVDYTAAGFTVKDINVSSIKLEW